MVSVPVLPQSEMACNRAIPGPTEDLTPRKKLIFFGLDRMRLHLDDKLASEREDPLQVTRSIQRR